MMKSGATDVLVKELFNIKLKYSMSRKLEKPWMSAPWATRVEEDGGECFAPLFLITMTSKMYPKTPGMLPEGSQKHAPKQPGNPLIL